tara:strand:+ start:2999 stop:3697 length:699 start_codon:yes stop_codon:yes gene_type:complete
MSEQTELSVEETTAPERPEWLPEKFNTAEDMATSYSNLESKIGAKDEELRESITQEMQDNFYANRPETSGHYELPESIDEELANDNELLKWWANESWENGYNQEQFSKGINMYTDALQANQPNLEKELGALGDNAQARVDAVSLWSQANFPEESRSAFEDMAQTAKGIETLEMIIEKLKGATISGTSNPTGLISESDLTEMMKDPRYWNAKDRNPDFIKQVDEGFAKLYAKR